MVMSFLPTKISLFIDVEAMAKIINANYCTSVLFNAFRSVCKLKKYTSSARMMLIKSRYSLLL